MRFGLPRHLAYRHIMRIYFQSSFTELDMPQPRETHLRWRKNPRPQMSSTQLWVVQFSVDVTSRTRVYIHRLAGRGVRIDFSAEFRGRKCKQCTAAQHNITGIVWFVDFIQTNHTVGMYARRANIPPYGRVARYCFCYFPSLRWHILSVVVVGRGGKKPCAVRGLYLHISTTLGKTANPPQPIDDCAARASRERGRHRGKKDILTIENQPRALNRLHILTILLYLAGSPRKSVPPFIATLRTVI